MSKKTRELVYFCPGCEEVRSTIEQVQTVHLNDERLRLPEDTEYRCPSCGEVIPCKGNWQDLVLQLRKNQPEMLSLKEISTQIGKSLLSGVDVSYILNLANGLLPGKYSYGGNNMFVKKDD